MALEKEHGRARTRRRGICVCIGHGGDDGDHAAAAEAGRPRDLLRQRVRRDVPALRQDRQALRRGVHLCEHVDPARCRKCDAAEHPDGVHRNADEPDHVDYDIRAVSGDRASQRTARVVVDNTFMSPYFQRPIELGADIVVHCTTKYLNGHSDSVGGVAVLKHQEDAERLQFIQNAAGAILSPFDSWLVLRGIKTLPVRMDAHNANGMAVAKYLAAKETGAQDLLSRACRSSRP